MTSAIRLVGRASHGQAGIGSGRPAGLAGRRAHGGRVTDPDGGERTLSAAAAAGIDLATITAQLEREGIRSFCDSYHKLLDCIERKLAGITR